MQQLTRRNFIVGSTVIASMGGRSRLRKNRVYLCLDCIPRLSGDGQAISLNLSSLPAAFLKWCWVFHPNYSCLSIDPPIAISKKGESAVAEYDLPEKRGYIFVIRFKAANLSDARQLMRLLGSPAYQYYAKESVENGHPEMAPRLSLYAVTNMQNLQDGVQSGKYVLLTSDTSRQIHVHIVVSSLREDGDVQSVFVDKDVNTNTYFVGSRNFRCR